MSYKYKDFDEHFAEAREETIDFKLRGREYSLPASPSFDVVLDVERMLRGLPHNKEVKGNRLERMCKKLFGDENFQKMVDDGVTLQEMEGVLKWVWGIYNGKDENGETGDGSGNLTSISSKTGDSSKPTSNENTE